MSIFSYCYLITIITTDLHIQPHLVNLHYISIRIILTFFICPHFPHVCLHFPIVSQQMLLNIEVNVIINMLGKGSKTARKAMASPRFYE